MPFLIEQNDLEIEKFTSFQMILKDNIGDDGCCFYKAVSLYFDLVGVVDSERYGPDALRSQIANTLKNYGCFLCYCGISWEKYISSKYKQSISAFEESICSADEFVTDLEFKILSVCLQVNVHVFEEESKFIYKRCCSFEILGATEEQTIRLVRSTNRPERFKAMVRRNLVSFIFIRLYSLYYFN